MLDGFLLELRIIHRGAVIRLVRNGADNHEGHPVQVRGLRDRGPLHLGTVSLRPGSDLLLYLPARHELVACHDPAYEGPDVRIHLRAGRLRHPDELRIRRKRHGIHARNLSPGVAEGAGVHVVLQSVGGNHHIADIDLRLQRPGDSRINQPVHIEHVHKDLRAEPRVHLADAAAHQHHFLPVQPPLVKLHGRLLHYDLYLHLLLQKNDLFLHRPDNACPSHNQPPFSTRILFVSIYFTNWGV